MAGGSFLAQVVGDDQLEADQALARALRLRATLRAAEESVPRPQRRPPPRVERRRRARKR